MAIHDDSPVYVVNFNGFGYTVQNDEVDAHDRLIPYYWCYNITNICPDCKTSDNKRCIIQSCDRCKEFESFLNHIDKHGDYAGMHPIEYLKKLIDDHANSET